MKKRGRPTNEEKIDLKIARALKVSDLIRLLKKQPQDAVVGKVGHFGEMHAMDKYDVTLGKCYVPSDGWRSGYRRNNIPIVTIDTPDIGPDPD